MNITSVSNHKLVTPRLTGNTPSRGRYQVRLDDSWVLYAHLTADEAEQLAEDWVTVAAEIRQREAEAPA